MKGKMFKRGMTLAEYRALMADNEEYHARKAAEDTRIAAAEAASLEAQRPMLAALDAVGVHVRSVWDLVNTAAPYPAAIPVLLEHLRRPYPEKIREGIARSLAVPDAAEGWDLLLEEFENDPTTEPNTTKWGIACALSVIAQATGRFDEALALMRDRRHGENRSPFIDVFARGRNQTRRSWLEEFVDDPDIGEQVRWDLAHPGRRRR